MNFSVPTHCSLCPRSCGADRTKAQGLCGGGARIRAARAALHLWEEPCLSGSRGSGTVFFSGCSLGCIYCQNYRISAENFGKELSTEELAAVFCRLEAQGAHNLNLVTATHYRPWVQEALHLARPGIPVVWNTGGYETLDSVDALAGDVDVYLTDVKYRSPQLAQRCSNAPDYFDVSIAAAKRMIEQVGPPVFDEDGMLIRGVIVRHLALPGCVEDSVAVLRALAETLPRGSFLVSVMSQYTPFYKAKEEKPFSRRISTYEYRKVVNTAVELGLTDGYMQEKSSAREEYTPPFDLEGI